MLNHDELVGTLEGRAVALHGFVPEGEGAWHSTEAQLPCAALGEASRLAEAVAILADAGYAWEQPPSGESDGRGLTTPDGTVLGALELLTLASDDVRIAAASYVEQRARRLGIPLSVKAVPAHAMDYAVLSSQRYEMALLGWTVSPYPAYLCEWFKVGGPFHYDPSRLTSACAEVAATSDLERAQEGVRDIQQILADDLPMIPLYAVATYDSYRNVEYPFNQVLGGLSGVYGVPELAAPAAP
jgi:ABC-type transport system substrate-binding protein